MTKREEEIIKNDYARRQFVTKETQIDPKFLAGVEWADTHVSDDNIKEITEIIIKHYNDICDMVHATRRIQSHSGRIKLPTTERDDITNSMITCVHHDLETI